MLPPATLGTETQPCWCLPHHFKSIPLNIPTTSRCGKILSERIAKPEVTETSTSSMKFTPPTNTLWIIDLQPLMACHLVSMQSIFVLKMVSCMFRPILGFNAILRRHRSDHCPRIVISDTRFSKAIFPLMKSHSVKNHSLGPFQSSGNLKMTIFILCRKFAARVRTFLLRTDKTRALFWPLGPNHIVGTTNEYLAAYQVARLYLGGSFWLLGIQYVTHWCYALESEGHDENFGFQRFKESLFSYAKLIGFQVSDCMLLSSL